MVEATKIRFQARLDLEGIGMPWFELGILFGILLVLTAADLLAIWLGGFHVVPRGVADDSAYALLFVAGGGFYAVSGRSSAIATLLLTVAALVLGGPAALVLDFTTKTMGYPLADAALGHWDQRLGLDWPAYERWFSSHPLLSATSGFIYQGATLVLLIALVALASTGRVRTMMQLALAASVALIFCIVLGGFLPAAGPHRLYEIADGGKAYWADAIIRAVTERPRLIVLRGQPPLTTFPSYHTALGVLVTLACRRIKGFGSYFALFNVYWLLAVPVWGGHYFIDMIAGAIIAVAVYAAVAVLLRSATGAKQPEVDLDCDRRLQAGME